MKEATQELLWMSQKEENELSRDWADKNLDVNELEEYRKVGICHVLMENFAEYSKYRFKIASYRLESFEIVAVRFNLQR